MDQAATSVDVVVIFSGDRRYPTAAAMIDDGTAQEILLIESRPKRLTELGITRKESEVAHGKLIELGIPRENVSIARGEFLGDWRNVRILKQWLMRNPQANVAVICDRFESRRSRYALDQVLDEADRGRVHVMSLRDRRFNELNWWSSRMGWRAVFDAYLDLAYTVLRGEDDRGPLQSPDEYEQQAVRQWQSQK